MMDGVGFIGGGCIRETGPHRQVSTYAPLMKIVERYANHRSGRVYGVSVRVDCRSFH